MEFLRRRHHATTFFYTRLFGFVAVSAGRHVNQTDHRAHQTIFAVITRITFVNFNFIDPCVRPHTTITGRQACRRFRHTVQTDRRTNFTAGTAFLRRVGGPFVATSDAVQTSIDTQYVFALATSYHHKGIRAFGSVSSQWGNFQNRQYAILVFLVEGRTHRFANATAGAFAHIDGSRAIRRVLRR